MCVSVAQQLLVYLRALPLLLRIFQMFLHLPSILHAFKKDVSFYPKTCLFKDTSSF